MKEIQDGDVTFTKQIPAKTKLLECPDQVAAELQWSAFMSTRKTFIDEQDFVFTNVMRPNIVKQI